MPTMVNSNLWNFPVGQALGFLSFKIKQSTLEQIDISKTPNMNYIKSCMLVPIAITLYEEKNSDAVFWYVIYIVWFPIC